MSGLETSDVLEPSDFCIKEGYGVVPRSIKRLFELVESEAQANANVSFNLYCSFLEVTQSILCWCGIEAPLTVRACTA